MPQYQLDTFGMNIDCDEFTLGYIEAMFFADIDTPDLETYGKAPRDLTDESKADIVFDCARFQRANRTLLEAAYDTGYTPAEAGRDFWFSRVRHGVGYWDRDLGELGDQLHSAAVARGERYIDLGDDERLYYV